MSLEWHVEPTVKIGQEIFYIAFDNNCPAALTQRWNSTKVRAYEAVVFAAKDVPQHLRDDSKQDADCQIVYCTGYKIDSFIFDHQPDRSFYGEYVRSSWGVETSLKPYQVYLTQKEVEDACRWYPILLTPQEWMDLHGGRNRDLELEEEFYKEEAITQKDLEKKDCIVTAGACNFE